MKTAYTVLAAALALCFHGLAGADSGRSLNQVRSEINSGTWTGITLIEAKPKAPAAATSTPAAVPAASAPATTSASTSWGAPAAAATAAPAALAPAAPAAAATVPPVAAAATSAVTPAPAAPSAQAPVPAAPAAATPSVGQRLGALFGPPSGVPMNEAKRLDSPSVGIVLPTSSSASAASATQPNTP